MRPFNERTPLTPAMVMFPVLCIFQKRTNLEEKLDSLQIQRHPGVKKKPLI